MLASRIAAHAEAGEILVSSTLKQYTETDPSFQFEPRGEHHFKGLLGEHDLFMRPLAVVERDGRAPAVGERAGRAARPWRRPRLDSEASAAKLTGRARGSWEVQYSLHIARDGS